MTSLTEMAHWITTIRQLLQPRPGTTPIGGDQYGELRASITRTLTVDDMPVRYVPASIVEKLALDLAAWERVFRREDQNGRSVFIVRGEIATTVLENLLIELQHDDVTHRLG